MAILFLVLWQAGCFSITAGGGIPATRNPPAAVKAAAVAADIVTLPLQAGAVAVLNGLEAVKPPPPPRPKTLLEEIRADPEYIFTHRLDLTGDEAAIRAVSNALWYPEVNFTDEQLRRLYRDLGPANPPVLRNRHCSEAFLREAFAAIPGTRNSHETTLVLNLIENTELPLDLLEAIARDETRYKAMAKQAQETLVRRAGATAEGR